MFSQGAGDGGSLRSAEEGVPRPGEMDFVEGIEFGKRPRQSSTAFAEEGLDLVFVSEDLEEFRQ